MKNVIKKALTEWFDNLFIFNFGFNLFAILFTLASLGFEIIFACYSNSDIIDILFNPISTFVCIGFGYYGYQIKELIFKYYELEMERM